MHTYQITYSNQGITQSIGTVRARNVAEAIARGWSELVPAGWSGGTVRASR